ncbi:MAG: DNA topoisomerase VI subunit B, partial [Myxococcota bacterium]|nr:DNA topoisomerase VI subunit B [Myxococcota bacterium]
MAEQEQFAFGAKKGGSMTRPRKKAKTSTAKRRRKPSPKTPQKAKAPRSRSTAAEMAKKQRDISVSEFFAKNRHLLGFDNPSKALLTTVKEGVDNSLDACEEAGVLPDIVVEIVQVSETRFRIAIQDNGPGIVKSQVPKIFGSLLYGSKFHRLRQSRGQQGIGISAAGMYGLLTTGKPIVITTRTGPKQDAHHFELVIDTKKNEPKVKVDRTVKWEPEHGTRVEIELEGAYRGGQHSVDSYIRQISLANPHAQITYIPPKTATKEKEHAFPRVAEDIPPDTAEIKPHPYGVELGVLMQMFRDTKARNVRSCLQQDFSRVSARTATEICDRAKVSTSRRPSEMNRDESEAIHAAIQVTKIMAPPT